MDVIYWINLDRSRDRFSHMNRILKDSIFNVPSHRIKAFDSKKHNIFSHFKLTPDVLSANNNVTINEYACLLSHLETIRTFSKSPHEIALIFEDDVSLDYKPYWNTTIQQIIKKAPSDWEVLKLNTTRIYKNLYTLWAPICKQKCHIDYNTIAYIIHKKAAISLINSLYDGKYNLDNSVIHVADYLIFSKLITYVYKYSYFLPRDNNDTNIQHKYTKAIKDRIANKKTKRSMIALYKKARV
jgi:GR25 family glycosyltransferase involved in LPS biosynthesis